MKSELDDHLPPTRQGEILDLVKHLAVFEPTKIAVETPFESEKPTQQYNQWLSGDQLRNCFGAPTSSPAFFDRRMTRKSHARIFAGRGRKSMGIFAQIQARKRAPGGSSQRFKCRRIFVMTTGSLNTAIFTISAPQRGQSSGSTPANLLRSQRRLSSLRSTGQMSLINSRHIAEVT